MSDLDVFELRFATAYRRYLDEVGAEVDAAAIARSVAGGVSRRRAGTWGWPRLAVPAGAWLLVVAGLLAATLAGAYLLGMRPPMLPVAPLPSPLVSPHASASPGPSGLVGLTGTWSSVDEAATTLALHPCGPGEVCGRFEVTIDGGERCTYPLEYRPAEGDDYVYWTVDADSFHCAYDWLHRELRVRPSEDVAAVVWNEVNGAPRHMWTLAWTSGRFEPQVPPTIAGEWSSIGAWEVLRLTPCGPGASCGSLTLRRAGGECTYALDYRPRTYEEYVFWIASASGAPCATIPWSQTTLLVRPVAAGQVLVSHSALVKFTLYAPGYEPGPAASPPAGG